jgi:hypothetical protein
MHSTAIPKGSQFYLLHRITVKAPKQNKIMCLCKITLPKSPLTNYIHRKTARPFRNKNVMMSVTSYNNIPTVTKPTSDRIMKRAS